MSQHALLSPSSAETWMNCAGSAAMQKGLADTANGYSDEGTAAHLLGSDCLERGKNPHAFIGGTIFVGSTADFDGAIWATMWEGQAAAPSDFTIRRTYVVDDDMADHVAKYVNAVREIAGPDGVLMAEQRVSISTFTGEADAAGTSDAVIIRGDELIVVDLKFGMGVRVSAERNKQLMIYALGVREQVEFTYGPFKRIRFVISQPRLDHLSEWDCTSEELDAFGGKVRVAASAALAIYDFSADIPPPPDILSPSEDACRWCKAKPDCPAAAKKITDTLADDFDVLGSDDVGAPGVDYPADVLAQKMAAIPFIEDWCKAVRAKVESEVFAGNAIPGWKLVMGKRGNRSWLDEAAADALLKKMRLPVEERCNLKLKSPTQIEKLLKAEPRRLKRLLDANLVGQKDGQPSVAPESDPRPMWVKPDTAADFSAAPTTEEEMA